MTPYVRNAADLELGVRDFVALAWFVDFVDKVYLNFSI
jgi:hypothetical protein